MNGKQPDPTGNGIPVVPLVIKNLLKRSEYGEKSYGTVLKTFNGRDALVDAYEEALDLAIYLRQAIEERKKKENE